MIFKNIELFNVSELRPDANGVGFEFCRLPAALDAHLRSSAGYLIGEKLFRYKGENSPAIDAGDPDSDYSNEPNILHIGGNGKRVNMGAYGNTPEAALTRVTGLRVVVR